MTRARIAVVGAGWWTSKVHLPALVANPRAEVVAVCDRDALRARDAAAESGAAAYTELDEMLAVVRPDGVVVATPHDTHFAVASRVLESGSGVLVEKPLATTAEDAWELVALAERTSGLLAAGLTYQYADVAPFVQEAVQERIGELRSVNAEFSSSTAGLFAATGPADAHPEDRMAPHGTTYSDPHTGGGQAYTQLSHLFGGLLWAAGREATDVTAVTANHGLRVDLVDAVAFSLDGGALCAATSTGTTPSRVPVRHRLRFHGTRGMVEWDMLAATAVLHLEGGVSEQRENPPHLAAYARERVTAAFVASLLDGTPTPAPGDAAAAAISLIDAALRAASSGRREAVTRAPAGLFRHGRA